MMMTFDDDDGGNGNDNDNGNNNNNYNYNYNFEITNLKENKRRMIRRSLASYSPKLLFLDPFPRR